MSYCVTFGNIAALNEKEIVSTLLAMADEVERVVNDRDRADREPRLR